MNATSQFLRTHGISVIGLAGLSLVLVGFFLGVAVHMAFFALVAVGAFGPGVLRECGLAHDLDEFQREAGSRAARRGYLVTGIFLTAVVIARQWGTLRLGDLDSVPASLVLTLLLVVYGGSYALSFWDAPKAAFISLSTLGLAWLTFVVLSHWSTPLVAFVEGVTVAGPFIVAALLARPRPRLTGLLLLVLSVALCLHFNLVPTGPVPAQRLFRKLFVMVLIPVPLATMGLALLGSRHPEPR